MCEAVTLKKNGPGGRSWLSTYVQILIPTCRGQLQEQWGGVARVSLSAPFSKKKKKSPESCALQVSRPVIVPVATRANYRPLQPLGHRRGSGGWANSTSVRRPGHPPPGLGHPRARRGCRGRSLPARHLPVPQGLTWAGGETPGGAGTSAQGAAARGQSHSRCPSGCENEAAQAPWRPPHSMVKIRGWTDTHAHTHTL